MTKFARVPLSLASNKGLGSDAQVYIVLMSYADETGHAWPKVETLARQTGLHERTVQRSLRRLVDARLIKMELPKPGHPSSNVYSIVDHPGVTVSPPQGGEVDTSGVTTAVTPGVTQRATQQTRSG